MAKRLQAIHYRAKLQRIIAFSKDGQFRQMEKACRQLLEKVPGDFDALQLLGLALSRQGNQKDALFFLEKALEQNSTHVGARNNLGYAYIEAGRYQEAINHLRETIRLDPTQAEIFNNLGIALSHTGAYAEAIAAYQKAIELNPRHLQAIGNLGICLRRTGRLHDAIAQHLMAVEINPTDPGAYIHLYQALALSHVTDDALHVAETGLSVSASSPKDRLELLTGIAIMTWLSGQIDMTRAAVTQLDALHSDYPAGASELPSSFAYHRYIAKLLKIRTECPDLYTGSPDRPMFFVGESHCLSPSETVVQHQGQPYRTLSTFIHGCKAWHLGRTEDNEYKKSLEILFRALPLGSTIIVGLGEIDCRINEGIFAAYLEKGINFRTSIPEIVERYIDYVSVTAEQFGHTLIFYGVPAPNRVVLRHLAPESSALFQEVIRLFNENLKAVCQRRRWELLDVYGLTANAAVPAGSQYHIDEFHLHPRTLGILLRSHLIAPDR